MKFGDFVKLYSNSPFIDSSTFSMLDSPDYLRRQVQRWLKKGYIITLKRGLYVFNDLYRKSDLPLEFMANILVVPSYVSLTYALCHHDLVPEMATVITSVTTKKTRIFKNHFGRFEYRSVKKDVFRGYQKEEFLGQNVFMASPEKALIDYFYFNTDKGPDLDYFESLRLQNLGKLNTHTLSSYAGLYNSRVDSIIHNFINYMNIENKRYKTL